MKFTTLISRFRSAILLASVCLSSLRQCLMQSGVAVVAMMTALCSSLISSNALAQIDEVEKAPDDAKWVAIVVAVLLVVLVGAVSFKSAKRGPGDS